MSSLQLTGKCLFCACAHMRLGTCSVLRLLYKACYIFNKGVMKFAFTFLSDSFSGRAERKCVALPMVSLPLFTVYYIV